MPRLPVVFAPMAGVNTPKIVADACNAGLLGSLGAGMLSPDDIRSKVREIRERTSHKFNVNLFVIDNAFSVQSTDVEKQTWIYKYAQEKYGFETQPPKELAPPYAHSFADQFAAVLETKPPIVSFTFGIAPASDISRCKDAGISVWGTATAPEEVQAWKAAGADVIVLQGSDAGGHQGTLASGPEPRTASLADMWDAAKAAAGETPLVAAGGIMDGGTVKKWIDRGALYCQIGTLFLGASDSPVHPAWKRALRGEYGNATTLTRIFSGRWARTVATAAVQEGGSRESLPYPAQLKYTAPLRGESVKKEDPGFTSLWAGTGFPLCRDASLREITEGLVREYNEASAENI